MFFVPPLDDGTGRPASRDKNELQAEEVVLMSYPHRADRRKLFHLTAELSLESDSSTE